MENAVKTDLESRAKEIRIKTIKMIGDLGVGHIGGAMSVVDLLTLLYFEKMNINPADPQMADRDKLVLSKGHAGPALYSVLATLGYFPEQWLETLNRGGTNLPSHCDMKRTPGIDMTTGSLGQGLSAAVGLALANRLDSVDKNVFCIIGDGESDEGQNWEAAIAAPHFKLDRIIAFTDCNKMQIDGLTEEVMGLGSLAAKWEAFGWDTCEVDGHNFDQMSAAIDRARENREKPSMIICHTIKGKGCSFAEGVLSNHNMVFDSQQAAEAIKALKGEN